MSDDWLIVIPENPYYVPDAERQSLSRNWRENVASGLESVQAKLYEQVMFFDCGADFERVFCPSCQAEIPHQWWNERMGEDCDAGFKLQLYRTPCCGVHHTLHDLKYDWPQGFGCFALEAKNLNVGGLKEKDWKELSLLLGAPVRLIYRHV